MKKSFLIKQSTKELVLALSLLQEVRENCSSMMTMKQLKQLDKDIESIITVLNDRQVAIIHSLKSI